MLSTHEHTATRVSGLAEQRARRARIAKAVPTSAALVILVGAALTTVAMVQLLGLAG